jgi:hypothetical protein
VRSIIVIEGEAMKSLKRAGAALLSFLCLVAQGTSTAAQTQAQQDRLDVIARFIGAAPFCARLGMEMPADAGEQLGALLEQELREWQGDQQAIERMVSETIARRTATMKIDLERASEQTRSEAQLRGVKAIYLRYGSLCLQAARDKTFARVLTVPAGYSLEEAATKVSDESLAQGGLASWQTPAIQARGDLLMAAGACRARIGADRSDALLATYGKSDDQRTRDYYLHAFDLGLNDTEMNFTTAQCERVIRNYKAKIAATGR